MGSLSNNENPDVLLQNAAFHQGLQCFRRQEQSSEKEIHVQYHLEIITWDPSMYNEQNHPNFIASNQMEEFFSTQRVRCICSAIQWG